MPVDSLVLMLLIGLVLGGVSGVFLRSDKMGFFVNVALAVIGAALGAFLPLLINANIRIDVSNFDYLIRALMGSFLLVITASLFRSAKPGL